MKNSFQQISKWACEDGHERSGQWPKVRAGFLKAHPSCAACGSTMNLEVHHRTPFGVDPSLELCEDNLVTLCESSHFWIRAFAWLGFLKIRGPVMFNCHFRLGHLGNWKNWNPNVVDDAAKMLQSISHK